MLARRATLAFPPLLLALLLALAVPAGAIHLFPNVPGDPGGDCGAALEADPGGSAKYVSVAGFDFRDQSDGTSTSQVNAGQSVTWRWDLPHCHSVTFQSNEVQSTDGKQPGGFEGDEPQLVKPEGNRNTFTVKFDKPGNYNYFCIHHQAVGMTGVVVVS